MSSRPSAMGRWLAAGVVALGLLGVQVSIARAATGAPMPGSATASSVATPSPTPEAVRGALLGVIDPELGDNVVELGMVHAVDITPGDDGGHVAVTLSLTTAGCPLRAQCTDSKTGRQITIGRHEAHLAAARTRQQDPAWKADYRATRPKIERKIAHLMRRRHGGRRARMRGRLRIAADFTLLAAAVNLARLATLGLTHTPQGWTLTTT